MTKIDIISGFLGAGKTTFIKKLLQEAVAGEQVVLIENEFGEIGIDGGFLKDAGIEIREMNSGCICCSLVGDFGRSLSEVLTKYKPDRVIIEPSGVGKLSDVMKAVRDVASQLEVTLNSAVTLVDASKCKMYMKNFGEFFNNQIEYAGTIVMSRTDVVLADKVQADVELIREHNPDAVIITTPCSQLSGAQLLEIIEKPDTMEEDLLNEVKSHRRQHRKGCGCGQGQGGRHGDGKGCGCGQGHGHHHGDGEGCGQGHGHHHGDEEDHAHHHHGDGEACGCGQDHAHHHADEVFTSWGMENVPACDRKTLDAILEELANGDEYGEVLRAKGMLPVLGSEEWVHFDLVPDEYEIRTGKPDYTGKVCVIGANLKTDALKTAFSGS